MAGLLMMQGNQVRIFAFIPDFSRSMKQRRTTIGGDGPFHGLAKDVGASRQI